MSGVAPKKSLGQHFLVDRNVLGVVGRLAARTDANATAAFGLPPA